MPSCSILRPLSLSLCRQTLLEPFDDLVVFALGLDRGAALLSVGVRGRRSCQRIPALLGEVERGEPVFAAKQERARAVAASVARIIECFVRASINRAGGGARVQVGLRGRSRTHSVADVMALVLPDFWAHNSSASTRSLSLVGLIEPQHAMCSGVHSFRVLLGCIKSASPALIRFRTAPVSPIRICEQPCGERSKRSALQASRM